MEVSFREVLHPAIQGGDVECVRAYLCENRHRLPEILHQRGPVGVGVASVLHTCTSSNNCRRAEIASIILEEEACCGRRVLDMVKWQDAEGLAVIHAVAEMGDLPLLHVLTKHKEMHPSWKLDLNGKGFLSFV